LKRPLICRLKYKLLNSNDLYIYFGEWHGPCNRDGATRKTFESIDDAECISQVEGITQI
jgi:hypothetical protein